MQEEENINLCSRNTCQKKIPKTKRKNAKFCSATCRKHTWHKNLRLRRKLNHTSHTWRVSVVDKEKQ